MPTLTLDAHPLLDARVLACELPAPLAELPTPPELLAFFGPAGQTPEVPFPPPDDALRRAVRDLLRHGGFKPTGRNKPASEYLIKAVDKGWLSPTSGINLAVDVCNLVSLHSGLPISVLDADLAAEPRRIGVCPPGTSYAFNPAGQVIDVTGLLALFDAEGPCGGPVKDSQRTKTHPETRCTLSVIWGTRAAPERTEAAARWYAALLTTRGAEVSFLGPGAPSLVDSAG